MHHLHVLVIAGMLSAMVDELAAIADYNPGVRTQYMDPARGEAKTAELLAPENDMRLFRYTRFSNAAFRYLFHMIKEHIEPGMHISRKQKMLIVLRMFAAGLHYRDVAEDFYHSVSTISRVFYEVLRALLKVYPEVVRPAEAVDSEAIRAKGGKY